MSPKLKKSLTTLVKIGVSILLLYLVFTNIDSKKLWQAYKTSNLVYIGLALVLFVLSQVVSSFRLNYLLHSEKMFLAHRSNIKLYLLGMFYNFFIPGGIGGDAYKVYLLNKNFGWKTKSLVKTLFLDRAIGLGALLAIAVLALYEIPFFEGKVIWLILAFAIISILGYYILKLIFKKGDIYWKTYGYSLCIQGLQIASVIAIIKALGIDHDLLQFVLIFLISSALSVLSFAGIGVREFIFKYAAEYVAIDTEISVVIALWFSIITAVVSLFGIYYLFNTLVPSLQSRSLEEIKD
ncbi:lysylphosphatidylglycerol synthase transmembrane domain-containing protein [Sungkyunkwania multivorans]|uniref:Lysylphosphatidylglycerol synthase transmembrane domain-containing protein n=1 Tax=Sungkyunkwania multivorans TaxID=1173618 RepID=A0ABW3CXT0_9FLAO